MAHTYLRRNICASLVLVVTLLSQNAAAREKIVASINIGEKQPLANSCTRIIVIVIIVIMHVHVREGILLCAPAGEHNCAPTR